MDTHKLENMRAQLERMLVDLKHERGLAEVDPDFAMGRLKGPRPCIFNSDSKVPAFFFASLEDVIEMTERSLAYVNRKLQADKAQASVKSRKLPRGTPPLRKPWE